MGQKGPPGHCRVCGQYAAHLSFEHVPPKKAFNAQPAVLASMERYIELSSSGRSIFTQGKISQKGCGAHTLCERCNNNTGAWYGPEYVRWASRALSLLQAYPSEHTFSVCFRDFKPLNFTKQILTMIFSVNGPSFGDRHPYLRKFVLDRETQGLPPQYDLYLTLIRKGFSRGSPLTGAAAFETGAVSILSEVAHVPFAAMLAVDSPPLDSVCRITRFANFKYNEVADVQVQLLSGEVNTIYPGDYRDSDDVEVARSRAEEFRQGNRTTTEEEALASSMKMLEQMTEMQRRMQRNTA